MKLFQHTALFFMALVDKYHGYVSQAGNVFLHEVPWVILPDVLMNYIPSRRITHFERAPGGFVSGMIFPDEKVLKLLSSENVFDDVIMIYDRDSYQDCAIGELVDIETFDFNNWNHKFYHALRIHFMQENVSDIIVRDNLIEVSERFQDVFRIRHSDEKIDGDTLKEQLSLFEQLGCITVAEAAFNKSGVVLNNEWIEKNVYETLYRSYPRELANYAIKQMMLPNELDFRISNQKFLLNATEKKKIYIAEDIDFALSEVCSKAYTITYKEL